MELVIKNSGVKKSVLVKHGNIAFYEIRENEIRKGKMC
jgi:hypothetical protein